MDLQMRKTDPQESKPEKSLIYIDSPQKDKLEEKHREKEMGTSAKISVFWRILPEHKTKRDDGSQITLRESSISPGDLDESGEDNYLCDTIILMLHHRILEIIN